MSEEILVNITSMETRVAQVHNGVLQELHIERTGASGYVGNIYKGKVVRVLPGIQSAFVDIGIERTGFIHAADISLPGSTQGGKNARRKSECPDIRTQLHDGKKLIIQVLKDPLGSKGARLTTQLSVPSRYLVYMPNTQHLGISQRIVNEPERQRLLTVVQRCIAEQGMTELGGFIIRTAAEGAGETEITADLRYFKRLWAALEKRMSEPPCPALIYEDLPLYMRALRDLVRPGLEKIRVDQQHSFQQIKQFAEDYVPEAIECLEFYRGERPLFDLYGVEDEIQKALGRTVLLNSGGSIIIDQTEAMTTIDVNTGAFVGHRNVDETMLKTNLEAAAALARQLRLRNLGGIIIVDFIDMKPAEHRRQVHRELEKAMAADPAKTAITAVSELGLVEMTRQRSRESLQHMLCEDCPVCSARGFIKTAETICYEVFRAIAREARSYDNDRLLVLAAQGVVDRMLDEESASVADLEEYTGKRIEFQVEVMYHHEQFDVILL